jgi:hypothetical protein
VGVHESTLGRTGTTRQVAARTPTAAITRLSVRPAALPTMVQAYATALLRSRRSAVLVRGMSAGGLVDSWGRGEAPYGDRDMGDD